MTDPRIHLSWLLLRYSFGAVILLAGLDKLFGANLIVDWQQYISPFVQSILPFSVPTFLLMMGIVEVAVSILFFTKLVPLAAYLALAWLLLISLNLLFGGFIDIALRDILLAIGSFAIAQLSPVVAYRRAPAYA